MFRGAGCAKSGPTGQVGKRWSFNQRTGNTLLTFHATNGVWMSGRRALSGVSFKPRLKALVQLFIQENSIEERSNSICKVHQDTVIHLIDIGNFVAHRAILVFFGRKFGSSSDTEFRSIHKHNVGSKIRLITWFVFAL